MKPLFALALSLTVLPYPGTAQQPWQEDPTACPQCEVRVVHLVNVGDTTGGEGFIGQVASLVMLEDSTIVLTDMAAAMIKVFDSSGRFVRQVGRNGQGPGEYVLPTRLFTTPDGGFEMFDPSQGRRTTWSSDLEVQGVDVFPNGGQWYQTRVGDRYVIPMRVGAPDAIGLPLHVYDQTGERVTSFGADPPIRDVQDRSPFIRMIAPSSDTTFWSGDLLRFRVQHWTLEGRLLAEFVREPEWFPPQERHGLGDPPTPGLKGIGFDRAAKVLWTATAVPRPDWEQAPTPERTAQEGAPSTRRVRERESVFRTVVEALDPTTGDVLARTFIDDYVTRFIDGNVAFAESRTPYGEPVARLWRLELVR